MQSDEMTEADAQKALDEAVEEGWLEQVGPDSYRTTAKGRAWVEGRLYANEQAQATGKFMVTSDVEQ